MGKARKAAERSLHIDGREPCDEVVTSRTTTPHGRWCRLGGCVLPCWMGPSASAGGGNSPPEQVAGMVGRVSALCDDRSRRPQLGRALRSAHRSIMQMTQEDLRGLQTGTLPCQAVWKFRRDDQQILASQRLLAGSQVKIAYGTDCGMFPFSHDILEFQAM